MIHFLPIEPLWQRYSEQWLRWFQREFERLNVPYKTWMGQHVGDIQTGQFLDVFGTHVFKFTQLARLIEATQRGEGIKDGDTVFLMDVWFPGLEALAYIRDGAGIKFKIVGILHDGSYDQHDFLYQKGMQNWAQHLEESWFQLLDQIYVGTLFHKGYVLAARECDPEKIKVTGLPFFPEECQASRIGSLRPFKVIFPHRPAKEKGPEHFDKLLAYTNLVGIRRHETVPAWPKDLYYRNLSRSEVAVSYAWQEMFGISMLEACANGCLPLVPNRLAYAEIYPDVFKYGPEEESNLEPRILDLIARRAELEPLARNVATKFTGAIENMVKSALAV